MLLQGLMTNQSGMESIVVKDKHVGLHVCLTLLTLYFSLCRYWYVPTAKCVHVMQGHSAAVNAVAVTDSGTKTISASSDVTVKVWNTDKNSSSCGQLIYTQRDFKRPVLSAVLRGDLLASGTSNGRVFLTNIVSGEQVKLVQGHSTAVTALAVEMVEG